MERYNQFQDSDTKWFDKSPSHWQKSKNKFILNEKSDEVGELSKNYTLLSLTKKGVIIRDIESGKGKFPSSFDKYKVVNKGDLIFCLYDIEETPRTIGLSYDDGMITGSYKICSTVNSVKKYIYYYYLNIDDFKGLKPFYTGLRNVVRADTFNDLTIYLPPLKEQEQIVAFLDEKTSKIDDLVAKTKKKIELLKEKRTALINHCVTKGLNPNVEMKDSGVEWIGEIPSRWECTKFNYNIHIQEGPGIMAVDFKERGVPLIRISGVKENFVSLEGCNFLSEEKVLDKWSHFKLKKGDILISGSASTELVSEVDSDTIGAIPYTGLIILRPKSEKLIKEYIKLFVGSETFFTQIDNLKTGSTMEHFGPTHLNRMFFLLPLKDEQQQIVDYLDEQTSKIDSTISKEEKRIGLLKEYRQSLISNVVTGKIKVCN